jgi:hypothetical protein
MRGQFKFCVIEIEQSASGLILPAGTTGLKKSCYNLLYDVPFNPADEEEAQAAFDGCHSWLEINAVKTSKYVITEMFFYEPKK